MFVCFRLCALIVVVCVCCVLFASVVCFVFAVACSGLDMVSLFPFAVGRSFYIVLMVACLFVFARVYGCLLLFVVICLCFCVFVLGCVSLCELDFGWFCLRMLLVVVCECVRVRVCLVRI